MRCRKKIGQKKFTEANFSKLVSYLLYTYLRANVGIYRESQISSQKSNFGLYHPNNSLEWLFQKMILRNPQALYIWRILEKFENSQKIPF